MHDLARHAIHSTETVRVAISSISALMAKSKDLNKHKSLHTSRNTTQDLESLLGFVGNLEGRSVALQSRLQNEINLVWHLLLSQITRWLIIQLVNQIAQQQTQSTIEISNAARKDSAVMKTIALVTLTLLPATFVSALFSTSFFNFTPANDDKPERWVVSKYFWVYWAIAIPLTVLITGIWVLWHRLRLIKIHSQ